MRHGLTLGEMAALVNARLGNTRRGERPRPRRLLERGLKRHRFVGRVELRVVRRHDDAGVVVRPVY